ncbi:MAG: helix-turn-helix domain-containing protein [Muribaculaceae bacterium]
MTQTATDRYASRARRGDVHDSYCHLITVHGRRNILKMSPPSEIHITFVVTSGTVDILYNGISQQARQGDIYDIFANSFTLFTDASEDASITILCVPRNTFMLVFPENIYPLPHTYIVQSWFSAAVSNDSAYSTKFINNLNQLRILLKQKEHTTINNIKRILLKYIILDLCDAAMRRHGMIPTPMSDSIVELSTAFHHLFYGEMTPKRNITWYAKKLGVTNQYFSSAIKMATGHTPSQIINNCVARSICIDLCHHLSLSEIAEKYEFSSVADINEFLVTRVGKTASELQKIIRRYAN